MDCITSPFDLNGGQGLLSGIKNYDFCGLVQLANNLITFGVRYIAFPLAGLFIVIGGYLLLTAGGSEEKVTKGRQAITAAVVGLLIVLCSSLIIKVIFNVLGADTSLLPW